MEEAKSQTQKQNLLSHKILNDNVLLLPIEFDVEDDALDAPDPESKPEWGLVVGVGPGRTTESGQVVKIDLEEGDMVLFMSYGGTQVVVSDETFVYVRAEDIISKYNA